jgi:hypothetical protein
MKPARQDARRLDLTMPFHLTMERGRRRVPIGRFPSRHRALTVATALDWGGWRPLITPPPSPTAERP